MGVLCRITFHPLCDLSDYTTVGPTLGLTLTRGMLAIGPGVSQTSFSLCHQHRSTKVRSQDCSNHGFGPVVGAMWAAQTLAWPSSHMYVPMKSTAAKARPVLAGSIRCPFRCPVGAEFTKPVTGVSICSLCSCEERCQLFFLSYMIPGAQLWFQPHFCIWATNRGLIQRLPCST